MSLNKLNIESICINKHQLPRNKSNALMLSNSFKSKKDKQTRTIIVPINNYEKKTVPS